MARKPPPPHPKGAPRTPGSGRKKGTPNRKTVELRELMAAVAGDVHYQQKFRDAFVKRRLHPSTEIKVWEYAIGKPKGEIEMSARVSMDSQLSAERELFSNLSVQELEELSAESEALVAKAKAMARRHQLGTEDAASPQPQTQKGDSKIQSGGALEE